jgi:hypothetical protein
MRRALGSGVAVVVCAFAADASAQTWPATSQLARDRSPVSCPTDGNKVTFTIANGRLTMIYGSEKVEVPIAADGTVKQEIKGASGARGLLSGQTLTKTLEFQNYNSGCRYLFVAN